MLPIVSVCRWGKRVCWRRPAVHPHTPLRTWRCRSPGQRAALLQAEAAATSGRHHGQAIVLGLVGQVPVLKQCRLRPR
jgi:hypothetical protein